MKKKKPLKKEMLRESRRRAARLRRELVGGINSEARIDRVSEE